MSTSTESAKPKKKKHLRGRDKKKLKPGGLTAATSDKYVLYEKSVQEPEAECDLIEQMWSEQHTRPCRSVREDFCGTSQVSMEWVKRHADNTAVCIDLDPEVVDWAKARVGERLNDEQLSRIEWRLEDVRTTLPKLVDSVLAMNFSYYLFNTRDALRVYFENVHRGLSDDGIFLLDAYGGSEAFSEIEEPRELDGFTYVWEQATYDPISGRAMNYIHFEFPDGTRIDRAFEYGWRLWTLPEIQELLLEAGFRDVTIYWEGTDEDGEGNGEFAPATVGEACEGWVAYLVAKK
ncbi:MAG: class I SAM-dependent methyltransferase [Phycisphaerales bacterium]